MTMIRAERNAPCPCGSGKKFKRCHYLIDHEAERLATIAQREEMKQRAGEDRRAYEARMDSYYPRRRSGAAAALLAMAAAVVPSK